MGSKLHGINKKNGNFNLNYYEKDVLDYFGWGIKKKYGVYAPLSEENCKILAQILHNKADWLNMGDLQTHSVQDAYNIYINLNGKKNYLNDPNTIEFIHKLATWFEHCGGLRDVEGYNEE